MFRVRFCKQLFGARRNVSYVQGQSLGKIREYFYFIDHQGMLFLDDARMKNFTSCFKDKVFLEFFFKRVRSNDTDRYRDTFPFLSLCGRERNYIRCDDLPIVFTHLVDSGTKLTFGYAGEALTVPFQPNKLYMSPETGRVYHPAQDWIGVGLIRSKLAIELSKGFIFTAADDAQAPDYFEWHGDRIKLEKDWLKDVKIKSFNSH